VCCLWNFQKQTTLQFGKKTSVEVEVDATESSLVFTLVFIFIVMFILLLILLLMLDNDKEWIEEDGTTDVFGNDLLILECLGLDRLTKPDTSFMRMRLVFGCVYDVIL
jgi:hypothetical protein